jgi:hypothetical protein
MPTLLVSMSILRSLSWPSLAYPAGVRRSTPLLKVISCRDSFHEDLDLMLRQRRNRHLASMTAALLSLAVAHGARAADADRLVGALLGDTPLAADLEALSDEIGGRATGSPANLKAVEWGLARFRDAGVPPPRRPSPFPALWLDRSASASVGGDVSFTPRVVAMPFSTATPAGGLTAPLVDGGSGSPADFEGLGAAAKGAFVLVETNELLDLDGLFKEYEEAAAIEKRAFAVDAAGIVYMSSRPRGLLYRHNASLNTDNRHPLLIMAREDALRAQRLLRKGKRLSLAARIEPETGGPYQSFNVVGEIRGTDKPDEIVLVGAHLDSWDLGTGALDNGCNVALVLDVARQMKALGLKPRRTIRFALWNGEEQGLLGSWGYVKAHAAELDRHVMAASVDIGSGRVNGFFVNGRPEIVPVLERGLSIVQGLAPSSRSRSRWWGPTTSTSCSRRGEPRREPGVRQLRPELPCELRYLRQGRRAPAPRERGRRCGRDLRLRRGGRDLGQAEPRRRGEARRLDDPEAADDLLPRVSTPSPKAAEDDGADCRAAAVSPRR